MAENSAYKDCAHYPDCSYLNDVGWCPLICLQYRSANYVRVVRCKDCKWRNTRGCPYMNFNAAVRDDFDYCSDGERKDNDY